MITCIYCVSEKFYLFSLKIFNHSKPDFIYSE